MPEATYKIRPLTWVRDRNMLLAGVHYRIHPADGDGPHYLEINGAPNTVESIEAGKQLAWEDWQRRIGNELGVDPIADNLRRQCEALVLEREAALARIERVRGYAQTLRDQTGNSEVDRVHRQVGAVLGNILGEP